LLGRRFGRLGIGIGITVLLLGGGYAAVSLSGSNPGGGGGGDGNEYQDLEGSVYASGYRLGDPSTPLDDISELNIIPTGGTIGDDLFVFFYGADGLNATFIHDWINDPMRSDPIKVQVDGSFIPPNEDIILDEFIHTRDNVYKGIKILDDGR